MSLLESDACLDIDSVDQDGRGVGRAEGKVVFVEGGITGEQVAYRIFQSKHRHAFAAATKVMRESVLRVEPQCAHYDRCGGCSMQHIDARAQVVIKQRILEENLKRLGGVEPEFILPPIHGPAWGYRHRARLSARYVRKSDKVVIGFNDRRTHHVVDMHSCDILPAKVSSALALLRRLIGSFECKSAIPQVELSVGEGATVFLIRHLEPLSDRECDALRDFGAEHEIDVYLQPKGPKSVYPLAKVSQELSYRLAEFDVTVRFSPMDFTQINYAVNTVLVRRAVQMLAPEVGEQIADLFCGLGNFSLPLACRGARVIGVEGSAAMVDKAGQNAELNGLEDRVSYRAANLAEMTEGDWGAFGDVRKLLIDPPRQGALAVVSTLPAEQIHRVLYISCNVATLARDAGILVREKGYRLAAAGVVNMFPHTSHVESMALFEH